MSSKKSNTNKKAYAAFEELYLIHGAETQIRFKNSLFEVLRCYIMQPDWQDVVDHEVVEDITDLFRLFDAPMEIAITTKNIKEHFPSM